MERKDRVRSPSELTEIEGLYRDLNGELIGYLRSLARDAAIAQDVAHLAWTKVLAAGQRGEALPIAAEERRALVFAIARNAYLDGYRRGHFEARTMRVGPDELERLAGAGQEEQSGSNPEFEIAQQEAYEILARLLSRLPAAQQAAVRMWQSGLGIQAMARAACVPRDTVLSRKKYGLSKLRALLKAEGLTASMLLG